MWVAARTKPLNPDIFMILIDPVSDLPLELAPVIRVDCVFKINNLTGELTRGNDSSLFLLLTTPHYS